MLLTSIGPAHSIGSTFKVKSFLFNKFYHDLFFNDKAKMRDYIFTETLDLSQVDNFFLDSEKNMVTV